MSEVSGLQALFRRVAALEALSDQQDRRIKELTAGGVATVTTPTSRVRVNLTQSSKGEWRIGELTAEVSGISDASEIKPMLSEAIQEAYETSIAELDAIARSGGVS